MLAGLLARDPSEMEFGLACIALGQIGGEAALGALLARLRDPALQEMRKPWISMGLACTTRSMAPLDAARHRQICDAMRSVMKTHRNSHHAAGHALALGLLQCEAAAPEIAERLHESRFRDTSAGYQALALGMLGYEPALPQIRKLVSPKSRRDLLMILTMPTLAWFRELDRAPSLFTEPGADVLEYGVAAARARAYGLVL